MKPPINNTSNSSVMPSARLRLVSAARPISPASPSSSAPPQALTTSPRFLPAVTAPPPSRACANTAGWDGPAALAAAGAAASSEHDNRTTTMKRDIKPPCSRGSGLIGEGLDGGDEPPPGAADAQLVAQRPAPAEAVTGLGRDKDATRPARSHVD